MDLWAYVSAAARALVGGVLLAAGVSKILSPRRFAGVLLRFPISRLLIRSRVWAMTAGLVISIMELTCGGLLFLGLFIVGARSLVLFLLGAFTLGIGEAMVGRETIACGCFGNSNTRNVDRTTIVRNLALIALTLLTGVAPWLSLDGLFAHRTSLAHIVAFELTAVEVAMGFVLVRWFAQLRGGPEYVSHVPPISGPPQSDVWEGARELPSRLGVFRRA